MALDRGYHLICLENPLLDIQVKGDEQLLQKYGLKANDAILAEPKHMGLYDDLLNNHDAKLIAGGAAQNTARGAQYMLPASSVLYLGAVGRDKYADILQDANQRAGLHVAYHVDETAPTGRCGVIITGHNRSMCTDLAAANLYKLQHLQSGDIWRHVQEARVYFVGGYHLTVCVPAVMALAEEAAGKNKIFILSLSAPFIPSAFAEPLDKVLPYCDYVIGNETEALSYAQARGADTKDTREIAKHIAQLEKKNSKRPRTVIITQGTDPTVVAVGNEGGAQASVKEFPIHDIDKSEIEDTTGAGDAFAGGFIAGLVENKTLERCVDMGHWLAKLSIRELGPSYPFPKQTYTPSSS